MEACSVEGCGKPQYAKSWCRLHYARMRLYGRLEKIRGIEKGKCSVEDCPNSADVKGLCPKHYQMQHRFGRLYKIKSDGSKGRHPLYSLWAERHAKRDLCEEWMDFGRFVEDVSPKPEGDVYLVKIRKEVYGPDNFKWIKHLRRIPEETKKAWHARKWASRRKHYPNFEADRWMRRKYGITREQYNEMLATQNGVCAICKCEETSYDIKTQGIKSLSVDHCHKTNAVRKLLCFRCNAILGRAGDSLELLEACKTYLIEHQATFEGTAK